MKKTPIVTTLLAGKQEIPGKQDGTGKGLRSGVGEEEAGQILTASCFPEISCFPAKGRFFSILFFICETIGASPKNPEKTHPFTNFVARNMKNRSAKLCCPGAPFRATVCARQAE